MTDNEIIRAWADEIHLAEYVDSSYCNNVELNLITATLDLINRQKADNQNLKGHLEQLKSRYDNAKAEIERLQKEVERNLAIREEAVKKLDEFEEQLNKTFATERAEAVKEFAERLHCHCQSIINEEWNKKVYPTSWADAYEEFDDVVDNLVKEMAGADGGS